MPVATEGLAQQQGPTRSGNSIHVAGAERGALPGVVDGEDRLAHAEREARPGRLRPEELAAAVGGEQVAVSLFTDHPHAYPVPAVEVVLEEVGDPVVEFLRRAPA